MCLLLNGLAGVRLGKMWPVLEVDSGVKGRSALLLAMVLPVSGAFVPVVGCALLWSDLFVKELLRVMYICFAYLFLAVAW